MEQRRVDEAAGGRRAEHDRLMSEFMALGEGPRLDALREWSAWAGSRGELGNLMERVRAEGLAALGEKELVALYLVQLRGCRRPQAARGLLGDLAKLKESKWKARYEEEREARAEWEKKARTALNDLENVRRRDAADLERERARVRAEERKALEAARRRDEAVEGSASESIDRVFGGA